MQFLIWAMVISATFSGYLTNTFNLPAVIKFTPELLSAVTALCVIVVGIRERFRFVAPYYWLAFGALAFLIICGVVANAVSPGPVLAGMRYYLRAIPFFFLPLVFQLSETQLKALFKLLLIVTLVQIPVASYQRWDLLRRDHFSGDGAFGTLLDASILGIFLTGVVLVMVGMLLRGHLRKQAFLLLAIVILIPLTINETKAIFVLIPAGLFVTLLIGAPAGQRLRIATWTAATLAMLGALLIPAYDYLNKDRPYAIPLSAFFTDSKTLDRYLSTGTEIGSVSNQAGRMDALVVPVQYVSQDPVRMAFGLGLGNASHSALGTGFIGAYNRLLNPFVETASSATFILETGLLGMGMILLLHWLILKDAFVVARNDTSIFAALAVGWTGVVVVISISLFYKQIHTAESVAYLFWFFSGVIAARRAQRAIQIQAPRFERGASTPAKSPAFWQAIGTDVRRTRQDPHPA